MRITTSRALAALCLSLYFPSIAAAETATAGMVKSTKGGVSIQRAEQTLEAQAGSPVMVADVIVTEADSAVGITLQDGTLLSAGPQSTLTINRFVFDSSTSQGEMDSSLKRGTLAVVSGKLSKSSPESVTYRTPTAILGVRGTEFVIQVKPH